jgi:hypothetical protein
VLLPPGAVLPPPWCGAFTPPGVCALCSPTAPFRDGCAVLLLPRCRAVTPRRGRAVAGVAFYSARVWAHSAALSCPVLMQRALATALGS